MTSASQLEVGRVYHLAEHIELQKDGWWPDAIDRTLQYELYASKVLTESSLVSRVVTRLGAESDKSLILARLGALVSEGRILNQGSKFSLPEQVIQEMDQLGEDAVRLEAECETIYLATFALGNGLETSPSWEDFKSTLISPLIQELGAQTFGLLRGEASLPGTNLGVSRGVW